MAFDNLRPHQSQIMGLLGQGRTLAQIADILAAQHGVRTTPGSLSRFASSWKQVQPPTIASGPNSPTPELTPMQHAQVDAIALMTELIAEIHASREESRDSIGHLAGKVAGLSGDIMELEGAITHKAAAGPPVNASVAGQVMGDASPPAVPATLIRTIWIRASIATALAWAALLLLWHLLAG